MKVSAVFLLFQNDPNSVLPRKLRNLESKEMQENNEVHGK